MFGMVISSLGCASFADRQFACRDSITKIGFNGYVNVFFGNVFQVGDCAIIKPLRVETGQYYSVNRKDLNWAVSTDKGAASGGSSELQDFARALKCEKAAYERFSEVVLENKEEVFGPEYDRWSRSVTKDILKLIKADPILRNQCSI